MQFCVGALNWQLVCRGDFDVNVFVAPGERGNELAEKIMDFPEGTVRVDGRGKIFFY